MDNIFLLFMFIGLTYTVYFLIFKRFFKQAFLALGVAVASFFLFGLATDLNHDNIEYDYVEETIFEGFHPRSGMPHHHKRHHGF